MLASRQIYRSPFQWNSIWIIVGISLIVLNGFVIDVAGAPAKIDPIAIALPNESAERSQSGESTTIEIERAKLVELNKQDKNVNQQQQKSLLKKYEQIPAYANGNFQLPEYILDLNDSDIAGPVEWKPSDGGSLNVIAWDLLPPYEEREPVIITQDHNPPRRVPGIEDPVTHHIKVSLSASNGLGSIDGPQSPNTATDGKVTIVQPDDATLNGHGTNAHVGSTTQSTKYTVVGTPNRASNFDDTIQSSQASKKTNYNQNRGSVHYSTTTPRTTTPRTTTLRTTTPRTTTSYRTTRLTTTTTRRPETTTTTRKPTTTKTTATTTTTPAPITTTTPLDSSYKLENEEAFAYTLPPYLADVTDPDLDVAVTFIVPTDNDAYNHTIEKDLLPPLEPFIDLNNIQVTPPTVLGTTTSTTTTVKPITTTTRPPTITVKTTRANWVLANPTKSTTTISHLAHTPDPKKSKPSSLFTSTTASIATTTTTTPSTIAVHSQTFNTNRAPTTSDLIKTPAQQQPSFGLKPNPVNPFLPKPFSKTYPTSTTPALIVTTEATTTTTTLAPEPTTLNENPFDSATIPPWLQDFDYPDVGPGVPYDPNNFKDDDDSTPAKTPSSINPFQSPKGFSHQSTSTTSQTTVNVPSTSSASPSKVTLPLPSINVPIKNSDDQLAQPTQVLIPPTDELGNDNSADSNNNNQHNAIATQIQTTSPSFNTNFPARFEPESDPTAPPVAANEDSFPPFQSNSNSETTKFEYTKNDDGKVISTPIQLGNKDTASNSVFNSFSGAGANSNNFGGEENSASSQSTLVANNGNKGISKNGPAQRVTVNEAGKYVGGFNAPAGLLRPHNSVNENATPQNIWIAGDENDYNKNIRTKTTPPPASPGKYTGGFGAPSGILNPNKNVANTQQRTQEAPRPFQNNNSDNTANASNKHFSTVAASNNNNYNNRFGGPPGILVPFDNLKKDQ